MIYDCFAFFNELELLEIRLNELNKVVDRFVLVEATRTFQKKEKPLYFEQNKDRFKPFLHKIEHIVVDEYPNFFTKFRVPKTWDYDNHQKEQIMRGLKNCKPDDVIIVSDIDEIPKATKVLEFKDTRDIKIFRQKLYYYYLNCWVYDYEEPIQMYQDYKPWNGSVMVHFDQIKTIKETRQYRDSKGPGFKYVEDGGWHYSFLGGTARVIQKLEAYAHKEHNKDNFKDPAKVEAAIKAGEDLIGRNIKTRFVDVRMDCPDYVRQNISHFENLILR